MMRDMTGERFTKRSAENRENNTMPEFKSPKRENIAAIGKAT